jgi:guanylate kinase
MTQKKKPIIVAIVGPSGSGKTTLVEHLKEVYNIPTVCSYTTRPQRDGEVYGREHKFASEEFYLYHRDQAHDIVAYTNFGGYHYWSTREQIEAFDVVTYVIDEAGLRELDAKWSHKYQIIPIQVVSNHLRADQERIARDAEREPYEWYMGVVCNTGALKEFLFMGTHVIGSLISIYR